jgi:hypothetical protein
VSSCIRKYVVVGMSLLVVAPHSECAFIFTRLLGTLHIITSPIAPRGHECQMPLLVAPRHSECAFILQGCWEHNTLCTPPMPPEAMCACMASHPNLRVVAWRMASRQFCGWAIGSYHAFPETCFLVTKRVFV